MGRKRKPIEVKVAEGNRSKVAQSELTGSVVARGRPRLPTHLTADERKLWAETVDAMPDGLFKRADEAMLETFAISWATLRDIQRMFRATGYMVASPQGPIRNPLLAIRYQAVREIHRAAAELGLSPAARARLTNVETSDEDDPMALLLGDDMDPSGAWATTSKTRN